MLSPVQGQMAQRRWPHLLLPELGFVCGELCSHYTPLPLPAEYLQVIVHGPGRVLVYWCCGKLGSSLPVHFLPLTWAYQVVS
jgi:hypothetical protein